MATIIKIKRKHGTAYRVQYYYKSKRYYENFPEGIPLTIVTARKKELEAGIVLSKAKLKDFKPSQTLKTALTTANFASWYYNIRSKEPDLAPSTLERYLYAIKAFTNTLGPDISLSEITTEKIEQFKTHQLLIGKTQQGINKDLHHLKHPVKLLQEHGILNNQIIIKKYRVQKSLPDFLTPEEIEKLFCHLQNGQTKLAATIIIWTGIRRSELILRCQKKDFDFATNILTIHGKNKLDSTVPLHPELIKFLSSNLIFQSRKPTDLILNIKLSTLTRQIHAAKKLAGINKKGSTHLLRHSLGCYLINKGFDIKEVKDILRHQTLYMTDLYTQIIKKKLSAKFNKITLK